MKYLNGYTDPFISPVTGLSSVVQPLPDLERGYVWIGDERSRPLPTFKLIDLSIDVKSLQKQLGMILQTAFVLNVPSSIFPNAQGLNQLAGLDPKMLKVTADGVIEVAIPDQDYATKATLERLAAEAQTSADEAAVSAEEATGAATEATGAATEATGAATTAAGSATAAAASALGAGASAIAAGLSAGSASSSASDASTSATNAANSATSAGASATSAAASLNTLLHTGITLQGDVYGSGGLLNPITLNFSDNPVLPGVASVTLPGGTEEQRPIALVPGMIRFNSVV